VSERDRVEEVCVGKLDNRAPLYGGLRVSFRAESYLETRKLRSFSLFVGWVWPIPRTSLPGALLCAKLIKRPDIFVTKIWKTYEEKC